MSKVKRPVAFWCLCVFLVLGMALLLAGQTSALFAYDFAAEIGLQESVEEVSEFGVAVNRAFGAGDTIVYIPLMLFALVGLIRRRRWAVPLSAAVMGISVYWTATIAAMLGFLRGVSGYTLTPGAEYWAFLSVCAAVGLWGIVYLAVRGDRLVGGAQEARAAGLRQAEHRQREDQ